MSAKFFLDTNIFLYSLDSAAPKKRDKAIDLIQKGIDERSGVISYQVVSEFCNVLLKKLPDKFNYTDCKFYINSLMRPLKRVAPSIELIDQALEIHHAAQIGFYDAQIIAAAESEGCRILYTEDFNPGQVINGVKVTNPFS